MHGTTTNFTLGCKQSKVAPAAAFGTDVKGIHAPTCSIWNTPAESAPEALVTVGISDEGVARYFGSIRPLYDAAKRCIGQLSGILLLLQTRSLDRSRDGLLLASVTQQIQEAADRLAAVAAPAMASRHYALITELLARIGRIRARLDRLRDMVDPASPDLDQVVQELFAAQRGLLRISLPEAGLVPVDFTAACCNCAGERKHESGRRS
jgi:hypothetical protein